MAQLVTGFIIELNIEVAILHFVDRGLNLIDRSQKSICCNTGKQDCHYKRTGNTANQYNGKDLAGTHCHFIFILAFLRQGLSKCVDIFARFFHLCVITIQNIRQTHARLRCIGTSQRRNFLSRVHGLRHHGIIFLNFGSIAVVALQKPSDICLHLRQTFFHGSKIFLS